MSAAWVMQPFRLQGGWLTLNNTVSPGIQGAANPQPKITYLLPEPNAPWGPRRIEIDLQEDREIDTIAMLFHTGSSTGTWQIFGRTAAQGPFASGDETGATLLLNATGWQTSVAHVAGRHHALYTGALGAFRYIRFLLRSLVAPFSPNFQVGVFALGRRIEPGFSFDWGAGRRIVDLSEVRTLDGGERGVWRKATVPEVRGSFSQLTDAELRRVWQLLSEAGESEPVLLCEAADTIGGAAQQRLHYGTLTSLDFFERQQANKSRIDFRLRHWL
ncbi:MAG: hypothetical protein SNJ79_01310 [Sphingomonadaceae bacterium]